MDGEFLIEPEDVTGLVLRSADRPLPSQLRVDPRHVEPVRIEIDADMSAVRETVDRLRAELLERYGFIPREVEVAPCSCGWTLYVDGEPVESDTSIGRDVRGELLAGLSRHLWRMLRIDDTAELITFARFAAPVAVDRAMPHNLSIEQLHRVLVRLLREDIPIKPLDRIIEVLAESLPSRRDTVSMVERVRLARRRSLVERYRQPNGSMRVVTLSLGAIHACEHLSIEPIQPDARRTRFQDRIRTEIVSLRSEHRIDPVVIASPAASRYAVATALRTVSPVVLREAELLDVDVEIVGVVGEGIRVPAPPLLPPSPPDMHGSVWNEAPAPYQVALDPQYLNHVVDVEVIE